MCLSIVARTFSVVVALFFTTALGAQTQTVLRYSFSDSTPLPTVLDQSSAGNDALAGPLGVLSTDVPFTAPGFGNRSFDPSDASADPTMTSGIATTAIDLLSNDQIAAFGGFTMECYFRWDESGAEFFQTLIDYAGTEKIRIDASGSVSVVLSDGEVMDIATAVPGQWHYVAMQYTMTADLGGSLQGDVVAFFDSATAITGPTDAFLSSLGDLLDRPIGVGQHAVPSLALLAPTEALRGRIFEPRVTLGVVDPADLLINQVSTGTPYIRGDCNGDGPLDIADAVVSLAILFANNPVQCLDACDSNADLSFNIADAVYTLSFLFSAGAAPTAPFPACGVMDSLGCDNYLACP